MPRDSLLIHRSVMYVWVYLCLCVLGAVGMLAWCPLFVYGEVCQQIWSSGWKSLNQLLMGTISKAAFSRDIAELVEKTADLDLKYQWRINDASISFFVIQNFAITASRVN
uniref:Uncharacterized protein n=1 Tax=Setaria digitata TaxID=48799 RepID=A0A915Q0J9_9BILA